MSTIINFEYPTLTDLPIGTINDLTPGQVAVFGASEATPYDAAVASHSAQAPGAIRAASKALAGQLKQYDFDLGTTLLTDNRTTEWLGVDLGDVKTRVRDAAGNRSRIKAATASILAAGAVPLILGGDDSVPIPVLAGFEKHGPVTVVQVDAHVDWADDIRGENQGYGSPMRRVAEMPWVTGMLQIGIRGLGSGEAWQHDDARRWGSKLVSSREWKQQGANGILEELPLGGRFVLSIDCDGFDPSAFPAVAMPTPGGLDYEDMLALIEGLAAKGTLVGAIIAEYTPHRDDAARSSALLAARLALTLVSTMRRQP
ncbi:MULTISPECIES: arginase family protein [unclassified Sphingomonas]|uniref:arginase family protein n=1 Tax=unclassified Sphingomonas TaxID=196159 RepID=UPI002269E961|nr:MULTISPECIES: arginase family protein [unclassified Sphingomonas]